MKKSITSLVASALVLASVASASAQFNTRPLPSKPLAEGETPSLLGTWWNVTTNDEGVNCIVRHVRFSGDGRVLTSHNIQYKTSTAADLWINGRSIISDRIPYNTGIWSGFVVNQGHYHASPGGQLRIIMNGKPTANLEVTWVNRNRFILTLENGTNLVYERFNGYWPSTGGAVTPSGMRFKLGV